jgi:hypothetical protein
MTVEAPDYKEASISPQDTAHTHTLTHTRTHTPPLSLSRAMAVKRAPCGNGIVFPGLAFLFAVLDVVLTAVPE